MSKVKSPAYKNMSQEQLEASIKLGQQILDGEADLVALDSKSLELRGKGKGMSGKGSGKISGVSPAKRKRTEDDVVEESRKRLKIADDSSPSTESTEASPPESPADSKILSKEKAENLTPYLKKIALSQKTSFQKNVLTALCQVPRGRYTTYGAISKHLSSSPRAVGNALKNNPFAPQVPCHRVLASGGGLGGFGGSWGRKGEAGLNDDKKIRLLRDEGVKFNGRGRVVGSPWEGFK
jgi:methylated-DNA-[protein]-cysteine S-methyltransferase